MTESTREEFANRLRAIGAKPRRKDVWLMVGEPTSVAAWKLHVSASIASIELLFERVLPGLIRRRAAFKMAADRGVMVQLSAGDFGEEQIGKVITVYPRDDADASVIADSLIADTRGVAGPAVATDLHLGGAVYARYGAVRPRSEYDRLGERNELIPDGLGNWISDVRSVPFSCPPGIAAPFSPRITVQPAAQRHARELLGGRYFVTDALRVGIAGSVLRAIDLRQVKSPKAWVLKQARPYCSEDALGRDRRTRLKHEAVMLGKLQGLKGIARGGAYFEDDATGYLPVAYVPGQTLAEWVGQRVAGKPWLAVPSQTRQRLLRYAAQLVSRLHCAHGRGVIHRDVSPGNVWIGEDQQVYLLDWECAHAMGSRTPAFRLGTPGFSDLGHERRTPVRRDDWQACGRVITFMLTGLDPRAVIHGGQRELSARLSELTDLRGAALTELLSHALAEEPSAELDAATLRSAITSMGRSGVPRRRASISPLFTMTALDSALDKGLAAMAAALRVRLNRLRVRRIQEPDALDAHSGIAGVLTVLAAAHKAGAGELDPTLGERAVRLLMTVTRVTPDLPGLVHGRAGHALAVAATLQALGIPPSDLQAKYLAGALAGRLDWPDFTHGAAGQGFAALACAQRLGIPDLAASAAACATYLARTQNPAGGWTLPEGARAASGECYTGFAHGAAGIMGFLGAYAAVAGDSTANAAWRRAESWLITRARRGRGARWYWPQSDSRPAPAHWWCHGAPGIALGWLCVARYQGTAAIAQEYLRRALEGAFPRPRSESLGHCHGLAGIGEIYLDAHYVLEDERWRERAAAIADVVVTLSRRASRQAWRYLPGDKANDADGLMLGSAGILHFLLRYRHPAAETTSPLLV